MYSKDTQDRIIALWSDDETVRTMVVANDPGLLRELQLRVFLAFDATLKTLQGNSGPAVFEILKKTIAPMFHERLKLCQELTMAEGA